MKLYPASILIILGLCATAQAAVVSQAFSSGFANGGNIPDGSTVGWSDTHSINGAAGTTITSVDVRLNVTGGFNGDLYAYLSHDGVLVPLLNRVGITATSPSSGFGYSQSGFNVTFSASGAGDVHFYNRDTPTITGGQLMGTWQPDGRNIGPLSSATSFDAATSSRTLLDAFNGHNPNGTWTLFIADLSAGGGQSHVQSWELDITAVPEPAQFALIAQVVLLGWLGWQRRRAKSWSTQPGTAKNP
jgi:subtilisin-like proprotein convertase family protein